MYAKRFTANIVHNWIYVNYYYTHAKCTYVNGVLCTQHILKDTLLAITHTVYVWV